MLATKIHCLTVDLVAHRRPEIDVSAAARATPLSDALRIGLALVALAIAAVHIKDFVRPQQGFSLSIPDAAKPGLYARMRGILQADTLWLSLYNMDRRGWPAQLARFEAFARAHGGRPHWGKEARFDRAYLRQQYPRLDDFAALAARYDPARKFCNAWLDDVLGA